MPIGTVPFDAAIYLADPRVQTELLMDALDSGDATYIAKALDTIARARGIDRDNAPTGNQSDFPASSEETRLSTLLEVTKLLGIKLTAVSIRSDVAA